MMAELRFERMWNVLSKYRFKLDRNKTENVICAKCNDIMIDPYTVFCGCHFCGDCIKNHIGNKDNFCPNECSDEYLEMNVNIFKDFAIRRNISKLSVPCPNNPCLEVLELENMDEHLRVCTKKPIDCPYGTMGCTNVVCDNIDYHLNVDAFAHSQLLVEAINNMKNDIDGLRLVVDTKEREVNDTNEVLGKIRLDMEDLLTDCRQKEVLIDEMRQEIRGMNEVILAMRYKGERNDGESEMMMEKLRVKEIRMDTELDDLKKERSNFDNVLRMYEQEMRDLRKETNKYMEEMRTELDGVKFNIYEMMERYERDNAMRSFEGEAVNVRNDEEINGMGIKIMELNQQYDFVWAIEHFNEKSKKNLSYDSGTFYKDDYKLCLRANIGYYMYLYLIVLRGDRDEVAQWPMRNTVTVSIINQDTMKTHKYMRCSYDNYKSRDRSVFNRPRNEAHGVINLGCFYLVDIRNTRGLIVGDSLVVCCSLSGDLPR